jgi:hypothetical protein
MLMIATFQMAGCSWFSSAAPRKAAPPPVAAPPATNEDVLKVYLQTMAALGSDDPARQADVFYEVEREYKRAPTTTATLRFALALITPNHPATKPGDGKRILEALLSNPEKLLPPERTFASILFNQVAARLKIEGETRRSLATLEDRTRSQANSDKRTIAQLTDEITRLKRALAEAEQKLDAIKEIERSVIERSPTSPGNRDTPSETQSPPAGR